MPFIIWLEWRNSQDVCHLRQSFVTLNHLRDVIEFRFVEIFAHRALARCRCCTRDSARETLKFSSEILCALRLNAVFQPLIQRESVPQIQDRALIGGALDCFELVRLRGLFIDLLQERRKLGEAKIFPVALLPAEQAEDVCVLHDEHRILIGNGSIEQDIGEPLHRTQSLAAFEAQFLFSVNDQERIARDGVQRLDPAPDEHRDFAEPAEIEIVLRRLWRQPIGRDAGRSNSQNDPG